MEGEQTAGNVLIESNMQSPKPEDLGPSRLDSSMSNVRQRRRSSIGWRHPTEGTVSSNTSRTEQLEKMLGETQLEVAALQEKNQELNRENQALQKYREASRIVEAQMLEMKKNYESMIAKLTDGHKERAEALSREHTERIDTIISGQNEMIRAHKHQAEALISEHDQKTSEHLEIVQKLETRASMNLDEVQRRNNEQMGSLRKAHDKLKGDHEEVVAKLKHEHQEQMVQLLGERLANVARDRDMSGSQIPSTVGSLARKHGENIEHSKRIVKTANETLRRIGERKQRIAELTGQNYPGTSPQISPLSSPVSPLERVKRSPVDTARDTVEKPKFQVGEEVEVRFRESWSPCIVHRCLKGGNFCVTYPDGRKEYGVQESDMRRRSDSPLFAQPKNSDNKERMSLPVARMPATPDEDEGNQVSEMVGRHLHFEGFGIVELKEVQKLRESLLYQVIAEVEYHAVFKSRSHLA